ncbi:MAG: hypothetical protein AAFX06_24125 [Planctomycetota bacterium]
MNSLTRRNILAASATAVAASCNARNTFAGDEPDAEWVPVQIHLHYQQSQTQQLKPVMEDILNTFSRRVLTPNNDTKHPGVVRGGVYIELLDHRVKPHYWTFMHDEGGSILLATGTDQMKAALKHLRSIARKHQARGVFYSPDAYDQGVPPVIELPKGVSTSLPVHHVA